MAAAELDCGIDVRATATAAVAMNRQGRVLAKATGVSTGSLDRDVAAALDRLAGDGVDRTAIGRVMVGATVVRDAINRRRGLRRTATIRVGAPLTQAIPPLSTWPADVRGAVSAGEAVIAGGAEYDGRRMPLDEDAIASFLAAVGERTEAVAIVSVFAAVDAEPELATAEVVARELGAGVHVSLSHEIGPIGLLERENTTTLNATLTAAVEGLASDLRGALERSHVDAELFITQNDGTLMAVDHALGFPVMTIGSGPASAMRGSAALSGVGDAVVVDSDGARTRVGALVNGLPYESARPAELAGVRTCCRVPEVIELDALNGAADDLATAVDRVRGALALSPLVAVGGAGDRMPGPLGGAGQVIRPPDGDVAAAVGAATAPVSGQAELICPNRVERRAATLADAQFAARTHAVRAGADPDAVEVVSVEEIPLTHVVDPALRIRVKAAGPASRRS
ncbi:MAG: hypothetical protein QOJ12_2213 [Thermoleophilales bacterium]|nr:hypothetical protein [Thermoleophilales bacterium]